MDSLFERLEALSAQLPASTVTVYAARSSRGRSRTYHFTTTCKKFRASNIDRVTFTRHQARALCSVCVTGLPLPPAGSSSSQLNHVALELLASASESLERARLHHSETDPSLSDTWSGRALRSAEVASTLGVSEVVSFASEVAAAARELTRSPGVSSEVFDAAERACAFLHASRLSPPSEEQHRLLGGGDTTSRFAKAQCRRLLDGPSRADFLAEVLEESKVFFGSEPAWGHQLPDRPFPSEGVVSVREWAYACWREARDEAAVELAARWYDQGLLALAAAPRRSMVFDRCAPRGDLAAVVAALGASRHPDRYLLVFEDVADSTVSALRSLAERDTKVVVTDRVSPEVLEVAVGLYDPRSSGPLSKLAGAMNAAKAC